MDRADQDFIDLVNRSPSFGMSSGNPDVPLGLMPKDGMQLMGIGAPGEIMPMSSPPGGEPGVMLLSGGDMSPGVHEVAFYNHGASGEMLDLLVDRGADLNRLDSSGQTPLYRACAERVGLYIASEWFIEHDQDPVRCHESVYSASIDVLETLVNYCEDIDLKDDAGDSPLHLACKNWRAFAIRLLVEAGANIRLENADGNTLYEFFRAAVESESMPVLFDRRATADGIEYRTEQMNVGRVNDSVKVEIFVLLLNVGNQQAKPTRSNRQESDRSAEAGNPRCPGSFLIPLPEREK